MLRQLARADVERARDVAGLVLGRLADVDDERRLRAAGREPRGELVDRQHGRRPRPGARLRRQASKPPSMWPTNVSNPIRIAWRAASSQSAGVVDEQDERPVGIDDPAEPRPERRAGRDRHRARDVAGGMVARRAQVDEERVATEGALERRRPDSGADLRDDRRRAARGPAWLSRAHPGEVARERRLAGEQGAGERVDVRRLDHRVVAALEADRRPRRRRDPGRAERARAVGRVDLDEVLVAAGSRRGASGTSPGRTAARSPRRGGRSGRRRRRGASRR